MKSLFKAAIPLTSRVVVSSPTTIEILPKTVTKASALEQISKINGFSLKSVIAFGDSGNDVEMLKIVGLGVAMANGRQEAFEAADIIIGPNYSDAIAKFLTSSLISPN